MQANRPIPTATFEGDDREEGHSCRFAGISVVALAAPAYAEPSAAILAAVADAKRPAADKERDADRKPAEIVDFAGVKPGDKVAEIALGGGYYTRVLAGAVGPEGRVYALMPAFFANRPGGLDAINALAAEYGNVTVVVADFAASACRRQVDLVWTTENYHDLANGPTANRGGINTSTLGALKPGGIYFVEDHSAAAGTGATADLDFTPDRSGGGEANRSLRRASRSKPNPICW